MAISSEDSKTKKRSPLKNDDPLYRLLKDLYDSGRVVTLPNLINTIHSRSKEFGDSKTDTPAPDISGYSTEMRVRQWMSSAQPYIKEKAIADQSVPSWLLGLCLIEEKLFPYYNKEINYLDILDTVIDFEHGLSKEGQQRRENLYSKAVREKTNFSDLLQAEIKKDDVSKAYQNVPTLKDAPAEVDELDREALAEVLASRLRDSVELDSLIPPPPSSLWGRLVYWWKGGMQTYPLGWRGESFMVQVHGPWGSGKSSFLNFLRKELESAHSSRPWIVIDFNAWQHQRHGIPWWVMLKEIHRQLINNNTVDKRKVWWQWWIWMVRVESSLWTLLIAIFVVSVGLLFVGDRPWGAVVAITAGIGGVIAFLKNYLPGMVSFRENLKDHDRDVIGPIITLFVRLISSVNRPVAIFIDDLDRCQAEHVVSLLEGIQNMFRIPCVAYVIAADRDWLRYSFEKHYADYTRTIDKPGHRLGDLFVEKLFQISVPIPPMSPEIKRRYFGRLLNVSTSTRASNERIHDQRAERELATVISDEKQIKTIAEQYEKTDPGLAFRIRVTGAKKLLSEKGREETEHRLQPYADLLDTNPRAMKRLVNAFGFHQAINLIRGVVTETDPLIRWLILSSRWPVLAELITEETKIISSRPPKSEIKATQAVLDLIKDPEVIRLITDDSNKKVVTPAWVKKALEDGVIDKRV